MVAGWQGQTPYGLIVFGEGEMVNMARLASGANMARLASGANVSGHMGTQHQGFNQNPSVLLEKQSKGQPLHLIMPNMYDPWKEDTRLWQHLVNQESRRTGRWSDFNCMLSRGSEERKLGNQGQKSEGFRKRGWSPPNKIRWNNHNRKREDKKNDLKRHEELQGKETLPWLPQQSVKLSPRGRGASPTPKPNTASLLCRWTAPLLRRIKQS